MTIESLLDRNEIRRLEKAAKDKNKIKLAEWASQFEDSVRRELDGRYKKYYEDAMSEGIDNFLISIAYTVRFSETTHLSKKKLPEFMQDLFVTVDMYRRGEYTPIEYKTILEESGVFFDDYQYQHISNPEKSIFDVLNAKLDKKNNVPPHKLKIKHDFESQLNFIYDTYVLEDDSKLDEKAKELKEHYKYVIEDMKLHNVLEENINEDKS